jgi:hypothetical protein
MLQCCSRKEGEGNVIGLVGKTKKASKKDYKKKKGTNT